jgi:PDZ domain-containing protein
MDLEEPEALAPERPRVATWVKVLVAVSVMVIAVVIAGFMIHVPYTTISPGASVPLASKVQVQGGKTFPEPRGDIRLLFIRERNHVNLWRYVRAKLDDNTQILDDATATGGQSPADAQAEAVADMASAKVSAAKVALEAAGYEIEPPSGVLVQATLPSRPDAAVLQAGDVIVRADGRPVVNSSDLTEVIKSHAPGETVKLTVVRDGKRVPVDVRLSAADDGSAVIGVRVFPNYQFPLDVAVDTAGIGGPSAGLAIALAVLDDLTPGDLTGGNRVAVTGTIDPNGNVGDVGGIEQKGITARAADAQLFLVPKCNEEYPAEVLQACNDDLARLQRRAGSKVDVVPVGTFEEALEVLRANGGEPVVPTAPQSQAA